MNIGTLTCVSDGVVVFRPTDVVVFGKNVVTNQPGSQEAVDIARQIDDEDRGTAARIEALVGHADNLTAAGKRDEAITFLDKASQLVDMDSWQHPWSRRPKLEPRTMTTPFA